MTFNPCFQEYDVLMEIPTVLQYSHNFLLTANYTVNITFVSPIDTQSFLHVITVQDPVVGLDVTCSTPNAIAQLGSGE